MQYAYLQNLAQYSSMNTEVTMPLDKSLTDIEFAWKMQLKLHAMYQHSMDISAAASTTRFID